MKRQEAPRCTVNGFSRRSRNGWLAVKNQYGRRSVLLKVPSTAEASPSSSPSSTATFSQRQRRISLQPFTDFTICAVNVNGFFKVDEGGSYSAGCLYSEEDYRTTMDEKLKLLRLEARKAKPSGCTPQRKVTKYMEFVGKFLATFSNTSFSDAGLTWGGFSATMRRSETVGTLINMVRDSGNFNHRQRCPVIFCIGGVGGGVRRHQTSGSNMSSFCTSDDYRKRLIDLYAEYDPSKIEKVDDLLRRYGNHGNALLRAVIQKYDPSGASTASDDAEPLPEPFEDSESDVTAAVEEKGPVVPVDARADPILLSSSMSATQLLDSSGAYPGLARLLEAKGPSPLTGNLDSKLELLRDGEAKAKEPRITAVTQVQQEGITSLSLAPPPSSTKKESGSAMEEQRLPITDSAGGAVVVGPDYRADAIRLYEEYDPTNVSKVDAQLVKYKGRETLFLQALAIKLKRKHDRRTQSSGDASLPSSGAQQRLESNSSDTRRFEEYKRRILRLYMAYAPEKAHRAEQQLRRYPGREEEVITAAVKKYGPEPLSPCAASPDDASPTDAAVEMKPPSVTALRLLASEEVKSSAVGSLATRSRRQTVSPRASRSASQSPTQHVDRSLSASGDGAEAMPPHRLQLQLDVRHSPSMASLQRLPDKEISLQIRSSLAVPSASPFDVIFHDFFHCLGVEKANGVDGISAKVARLLWRIALPSHMSQCPHDVGGVVTEVEMRSCLIQCLSYEEEHWTTELQSIMGRMQNFLSECRATMKKLQRLPAPLYSGFWVRRCIRPQLQGEWKRCWATLRADGAAVLVCYPSSIRRELCIPFFQVVHCSREYPADAPHAFARCTIAFQLTRDPHPLCILIAPEDVKLTSALMAAYRSWQRGQRSPILLSAESTQINAVTPPNLSASSAALYPLHGRPAAASLTHTPAVWVLGNAAEYHRCEWTLEDHALHMCNEKTSSVITHDVQRLLAVSMDGKLPIPPPFRPFYTLTLYHDNGRHSFCCVPTQREQHFFAASVQRRQLQLRMLSGRDDLE